MQEMKQYIKPLYKHNAERICSEIISYAKDFPRNVHGVEYGEDEITLNPYAGVWLEK